MSELVQAVVAQILTALVLEENKEDLILLCNEADFHMLLAQEPKFVTAVKTLTGADLYFLGVRLRLLGNKGSPMVVRRIL